MTRIALCLALLAIAGLTSAGCMSFGRNETRPATSARTPAALRGQPLSPVMPEQVTSNNAHALSQAMWDEMDQTLCPPTCAQGCGSCPCKKR